MPVPVPPAPAAALDIQFLFVGAQIRVLAGGSAHAETAYARRDLTTEISAIARGRHWLPVERAAHASVQEAYICLGRAPSAPSRMRQELTLASLDRRLSTDEHA